MDIQPVSVGEERPSLLSATDRARIREEMLLREELRNELAAAAEGKRRRSRWSFLRAPAFVTLLSGVILSIVGALISRFQMQRGYEQTLLEKRIAVASSYSQDLTNTLSIRASLHKHQNWLRDKNNHTEATRNELGMTHSEVLKLYLDLWRLYIQARKPDVVIAELRFFFEDDHTREFFDAETAALAKISMATSDSEIQLRMKEENLTRQKLSAALSKVIVR